MTGKLKLTTTKVLMCEVEIPDPDQVDGFEPWNDHIRAYWNEREGWWELSGANMGLANGLIIHPYQVDGLLALLASMRGADAARVVSS